MSYKSTNPFTGEVIASFDTITDEELEQKLAKAHEAFHSWSKTTFEERAAILHKAAELAVERREEYGRINTIETGKLILEATWEMNICADMMNYYADNAKELLKPHFIKNKKSEMAGDAVGIYQPLGIVYEIEPWNVPFFQATRPLAAQLMAGNVVVLKHASNVPQCAMAMEQLMKDAGLPDGVFTNLFINYDQSDRVIADPRVCGVTITGSPEAGRLVAAKAGQSLKRCVLELGGSDAMVVLPDADMKKVVQGAMMGRLTVSGQACVGDKRMFIHESLFDTFKMMITEAIGQLNPGDPLDPSTTFAPVCSKKAADKVREQIARAVEAGATAEEVGPKVPEGDAFVQPTILTGVTEENPIFMEEIFGPVLMLFSWKDEDEVIRLANGTRYGLGSSVYGEDIAHTAKVAAAMESGAVSINQQTMPSPCIPFGGIKDSGLGRELGREGIIEFTNQKYINSANIDMNKIALQF